MVTLPLQIIDNFLSNYTVGDILILVVILGALGIFARRSNKLFGIHLLTFGLLFVVLPASMLDPAAGSFLDTAMAYKYVGLVLVVLGPIIYAVGDRR